MLAERICIGRAGVSWNYLKTQLLHSFQSDCNKRLMIMCLNRHATTMKLPLTDNVTLFTLIKINLVTYLRTFDLPMCVFLQSADRKKQSIPKCCLTFSFIMCFIIHSMI